jgi:hypothetical protein
MSGSVIHRRLLNWLVAPCSISQLPSTCYFNSEANTKYASWVQMSQCLLTNLFSSPRPAVRRFDASEELAKRNKERDEVIERRLRPKVCDNSDFEAALGTKSSLVTCFFASRAGDSCAELTQ